MQNFSQTFGILNIGSQNFIPQQNAFAGRRGLPLKETYHKSEIIKINDGGKGNQAIEFRPLIKTGHRITPHNSQNVINFNHSQIREPFDTTVIARSMLIKDKKKRIQNKQSQRLSSQPTQQSKRNSKCDRIKSKYMPENCEQIGEEQCSIDEDDNVNANVNELNIQLNTSINNERVNNGLFSNMGLNDILTNHIDQLLPDNYSSQQFIERAIKIVNINELEQNLLFEFIGEQGYYLLYFDSSKTTQLVGHQGKVITCIMSQNILEENHLIYQTKRHFITYTLITFANK